MPRSQLCIFTRHILSNSKSNPLSARLSSHSRFIKLHHTNQMMTMMTTLRLRSQSTYTHQ